AEAMTGGGGTVYLANINSSSKGAVAQPIVEVVGYGVSSAPAERALIQLLIVRDTPFGDDGQPTATGTASTTPEPGGNRNSLTPLIDSLTAIGVNEEDVFVLTSPSLISVCNNYSRCSSARLDVTVDQPTLDRINAIVNAVGAEAAQSGMTVQDVGVGYSVADCTALTRKARELATTDAKKRAGEQAEVLGVSLCKLLVSSEEAPASPRDATGCSIFQSSSGDSWWTAGSSGLTVPVFNPSGLTEATVTVEVSLAYAIADGTG
ncbi:MAG TPA: SIMPL domain-containing protein, partial [Thermomicrobiales bacterium]|nr:SIMPL domain-containing protein [Thermomicrobiales bacterium]